MTPILLPVIAPLLQLPEVPAGRENWLWRRRISFELQLKAVPVNSVVPPSLMIHTKVSCFPGQAQLTFAGGCHASLAKVNVGAN